MNSKINLLVSFISFRGWLDLYHSDQKKTEFRFISSKNLHFGAPDDQIQDPELLQSQLSEQISDSITPSDPHPTPTAHPVGSQRKFAFTLLLLSMQFKGFIESVSLFSFLLLLFLGGWEWRGLFFVVYFMHSSYQSFSFLFPLQRRVNSSGQKQIFCSLRYF